MFEFWQQEDVTLYFPAGVEDGVTSYYPVEARAVVLWEAKDHPGLPACAEAHAELLLKTPATPSPGLWARRTQTARGASPAWAFSPR